MHYVAGVAKFIDRIGQRFGRLVVVRRVANNRHGRACWLCACDCGARKTVSAEALVQGKTRSCGCFSNESRVTRNITHGLSRSREWYSWSAARSRSTRPTDPAFPYYGARGICMCKRWRLSFKAFISDMGRCPPGLSLDRINNDGNYEPSNCRWATKVEQMRNRRNNIVLEWRGRRQSLAAWAVERGIKYGTLWARVQVSGWSADRALREEKT